MITIENFESNWTSMFLMVVQKASPFYAQIKFFFKFLLDDQPYFSVYRNLFVFQDLFQGVVLQHFSDCGKDEKNKTSFWIKKGFRTAPDTRGGRRRARRWSGKGLRIACKGVLSTSYKSRHKIGKQHQFFQLLLSNNIKTTMNVRHIINFNVLKHNAKKNI